MLRHGQSSLTEHLRCAVQHNNRVARTPDERHAIDGSDQVWDQVNQTTMRGTAGFRHFLKRLVNVTPSEANLFRRS
jgi:hypothetical protein